MSSATISEGTAAVSPADANRDVATMFRAYRLRRHRRAA
jgi:hypothetical protein